MAHDRNLAESERFLPTICVANCFYRIFFEMHPDIIDQVFMFWGVSKAIHIVFCLPSANQSLCNWGIILANLVLYYLDNFRQYDLFLTEFYLLANDVYSNHKDNISLQISHIKIVLSNLIIEEVADLYCRLTNRISNFR